MPLYVEKSEVRIEPVVMLRNAEARWITLADRAANWSPWKRAGEKLRETGATLLRYATFRDLKNVAAQEEKHTDDESVDSVVREFPIIEKKSDGGDTMAGQVIQAIIAPLSWDPKELKAVLGEAEFRKFVTRKAEKHDDVVKYVQADEGRFENLDVAPLGGEHSEVKAIFGELRGAEKADSLMAMPPNMGVDVYASREAGRPQGASFQSLVSRKVSAMQALICSSIELNSDFDKIQMDADGAISAFSDWFGVALEEFKGLQAKGAVKDDGVSGPTWSSRLRNFFGIDSADRANGVNDSGKSGGNGNGKDYSEKGDEDMTPETMSELRELLKEDREAFLKDMVEKADAEERGKEELAKAEAEKADSESRIKSLEEKVDKVCGMVEKHFGEKGDGKDLSEGEGKTEKPEGGTAGVTTGRAVDRKNVDGDTGKDSDGTDVTIPMDVAKTFADLLAQMKKVIGMTEKSDPGVSDQIKALAEKTDKLERVLRAPGVASGAEDVRTSAAPERKVLALKSDRVDEKFNAFNEGFPGARQVG